MGEKDIVNLSNILDKLVEADSVISINDFQDENGNYNGFKIREEGENYFKELLSVFDEVDIAIVDLNFLELKPKGVKHRIFKNNGGFEKYYTDLDSQKDNPINKTITVFGDNNGNINQSDFRNVDKTKIKQTAHPKPKEKQQNSIISFFIKFWWQILIPLAIGVLLILIDKGKINIGI